MTRIQAVAERALHNIIIDTINAIVTAFIFIHDEYPLLLGLLILMFIDFILGVFIAINPKIKTIKFSSDTLIIRTMIKFVFYSVVLGISYAVYLILIALGGNWGVWQFIVSFFSLGFGFTVLILAEVGSILEHLKVLGVRIKILGIDFTDTIIGKWHQAMEVFDRTQPNAYNNYAYYDTKYLYNANENATGNITVDMREP